MSIVYSEAVIKPQIKGILEGVKDALKRDSDVNTKDENSFAILWLISSSTHQTLRKTWKMHIAIVHCVGL